MTVILAIVAREGRSSPATREDGTPQLRRFGERKAGITAEVTLSLWSLVLVRYPIGRSV